MSTLQQWIHHIEEGKGARVIAVAVAVMAFAALGVFYDVYCFKNFSAPESFDSAQLARNLAQDRGFTTDVIRPLSVHLLQQHRKDHDPLLTQHPDLANPPVYPLILAVMMKVLPFNFKTTFDDFSGTYQPEILIALLNQLLFFSNVLLLFALAKRLFDKEVAWLASLIFVVTELFWRFSVSGLSTMLLIFIFLSIVWCLVSIDEDLHHEHTRKAKVIWLTILAGALIGCGCLTRYSFGWLIFPAVVFAISLPKFRGRTSLLLVLSFFIVVTPWLARNIVACGKPFGTAGYAIYQQTLAFPADAMERSLNPEKGFGQFTFTDVWEKLKVNGREILLTDVSKMGGSWLGGFLLFGLILPFRKPALSRMRIFLVLTLLVFFVVQAIGATHLAKLSSDVTSENLLIIFAPLVFAFGAALFFTLFDAWQFALITARTVGRAAFVVLAGLPLIISLFVRSTPLAYPPYYPPLVREISGWMERSEMIMSDQPWSVAWYGERQSIALTLNYTSDFAAVNKMKTVNALYLSPVTLNRPMLEDMAQPLWKNQETWPRFAFDGMGRGEVPAGFPLKKSPSHLLPEHLFLTDRERWKSSGDKK